MAEPVLNLVPDIGSDPEHTAIKLNALDATRAVEQTALLLALITAQGESLLLEAKKHDRSRAKSGDAQHSETPTGPEGESVPASRVERGRMVRGRGDAYAAAAMSGYLSHMHCGGRIVHPDDPALKGRAEEFWRPLMKKKRAGKSKTRDAFAEANREPDTIPFGRAGNDGKIWEIDFVASPLDGVTAFLGGWNEGTISALAGVPRGALISASEPLAKRYLVITAASKSIHDLSSVATAMRNRCVSFGLRLNEDAILAEVVRPVRAAFHVHQDARAAGVTFATAANPDDNVGKTLLPALRRVSKTRAFSGSSLAAGLCSWFPSTGINVSMTVSRRTHAVMLAIAAVATDGEFIAIPLEDGAKEDSSKESIRVSSNPSHRVLSKADIVINQSDGFFVATGVSETSLLKGVRFVDGRWARTQTLCLRFKSCSHRIIEHHQAIKGLPFRFRDRNDRLTPVLAFLRRHQMQAEFL